MNEFVVNRPLALGELWSLSTRGSFYPLQIIRCAYGRRLILVPQLLFGKMVELVVPTFGFTSFLPEFVRASDDVFFGSHVFCSFEPQSQFRVSY